MTQDTADDVEFYSLYPDTRAPAPSSRDLGGSMQARAARLCSPYTEATGFGWYLYPPVDFAVRWTGDASEWALLEGNEPVRWQSLTGGATGRLPHSETALDQARRAGMGELDVFDKYGGLPFIEADPRNPEMLEIIPGLLARTPPGWHLLLRAVPNETTQAAHQVLEGVIETDWYRAYLPLMVRLLRRDAVVRFHAHRPVMVAQPIPATALELARSPVAYHAGLAELPPTVWQEFVDWRRMKQDPDTAARYVSAQKRRRRDSRETR